MATRTGSPRTVTWSCPQLHAASRSGMWITFSTEIHNSISARAQSLVPQDARRAIRHREPTFVGRRGPKLAVLDCELAPRDGALRRLGNLVTGPRTERKRHADVPAVALAFCRATTLSISIESGSAFIREQMQV
jgi:hypothetical protein